MDTALGVGALLVVLYAGAVCVWAADKIELDEPVKIVARTVDGDRLAGRVTGYDAAGFELLVAEGGSQTVLWGRLPVKMVFAIHQRMIGKGTAEQWFGLGEVLLGMRGGRSLANKSFGRAVRMDASMKPRVAGAIERHEQRVGAVADEAAVGGEPTGDDEQGADAGWAPLSDQEQQDAIEEAKRFAGEVAAEMRLGLRLRETKYYLFYSDLSGSESLRWAKTLDDMYIRLCRMFALGPGVNIYRGKAVVFVFKDRANFAAFESRYFNYDTGRTTIGVCHQQMDGGVVISFFRQPNKRDFMAVLIHESAHGFVYRYRSPRHVVTWANEGLAEWVSREFGPRSPIEVRKHTAATKAMRKTKSMGGNLFTADRISPTQYGIAADLTGFMIRKNGPGYAAFINGIKDGQGWRESLEEHYGLTVERLVWAYGRSVGVKSLRP